jgi:hypothetical protein
MGKRPHGFFIFIDFSLREYRVHRGKNKKRRTYQECMQMVKAKPISFSGRERTFGL